MRDLNTAFENLLPAELKEWVGKNLPPTPLAVPMSALRTPQPAGQDPDELIRHRFLCRGGTLLLVGPTGAGKSSLSAQIALCFARGEPCLGLVPAKPLSVLIIQAENDEGDLAEMRDGVLRGLQWSEEAAREALERVIVATVDDKTGQGFALVLDALCAEHAPDLVFIDPAFAYLGGDASAQKEVSPFLRNMILPVVHKHNIGLVIVHHANKPPSGTQKGQYMPGDFAYLGAGSAEWANVCRGVLALRATEDPQVFELRAAKRGFRLHWTECDIQDGEAVTMRFVTYNRNRGVICWHDASPEQIPHGARPITVQDVVDAVAAIGGTTVEHAERKRVVKELCRLNGCKEGAAYKGISRALAGDHPVIREGKNGIRLTGKLVPKTPVDSPEKEGVKSA
jgi:hypothetical protein